MGQSENPTRPQIPAWQRAQSGQVPSFPGPEESKVPDSGESGHRVPSPEPGAGASVKKNDTSSQEEVEKYLGDEKSEDATTDDKTDNSESKGDIASDIQTSLRTSRNRDASASEASNYSKPSPQSSSSASSILPLKTPSQSSRDIPPIIMYPEFLLKPQKPPPLINAARLLSAAYFFGGVAAAAYGTSKFIVSPMIESLTAARHELASGTQQNLDKFNARLETVVSCAPPLSGSRDELGANDAASDAETVASDPTELYHRDIGTQTSNSLSRRSSGSSPSVKEAAKRDITTGHENRIKIMHSHLSEMLEESNTDGDSSEEITSRLDDLTTYLDTLSYSSPTYYNTMPYGDVVGSSPAGTAGKPEDDAVSKLRGEIRGIKGLLLSARNFPTGIRAPAKVGA